MAHHDHQTPHECHVKSLLQNIYYKYIKDLFGKNNSITFEQECTIYVATLYKRSSSAKLDIVEAWFQVWGQG